MISRLFFLFLISLIFACSASKKSISLGVINISQSDSIAGKEAIGKSDCYTCHKVEEKLIGPSFLSIATKYDQTSKNIIRLIKKIKEGGKGAWGKLPMTHHPTLLQEDVQKMVQYILSLNKN